MTDIIVTGAAGFLGQAVCKQLTYAAYDVMGTDFQRAKNIVALDVTNPAGLEDLFKTYAGARAVVHLAAAGSGAAGLVAAADDNPVSAVRTNIEGFVRVVEAAARHNIPRVIWGSSTTVYGPSSYYGDVKISESAPFAPTTVYGSTKAACEHLGPIIAANHNIDVVSLRLPMVYGPGRWYGGSQKTLVTVAEAAHDSQPLDVVCWTTQADWLHVEDAATAIQALVEAEAVGSAYHVAGHHGSLVELACEIATAVNVDTIRIEKISRGGPDLPVIDDSQIRAEHGWVPMYPNATAGASTYEVESHKNTERD